MSSLLRRLEPSRPADHAAHASFLTPPESPAYPTRAGKVPALQAPPHCPGARRIDLGGALRGRKSGATMRQVLTSEISDKRERMRASRFFEASGLNVNTVGKRLL